MSISTPRKMEYGYNLLAPKQVFKLLNHQNNAKMERGAFDLCALCLFMYVFLRNIYICLCDLKQSLNASFVFSKETQL